MIEINTTRAGLWTLVLALLALPAGAAERKLLSLESAPTNTVELAVLDKPGAQQADPIAAFPTWKLKPGDPIRADARPPDRIVELYSGTVLAPSLLCRVLLRYYASDSGWTPQFQLDDEPAVARVNGRWQPLGGIAGLVRFGNTLPNAEGFFPTIEFGLGAGSLSIVAWQVR